MPANCAHPAERWSRPRAPLSVTICCVARWNRRRTFTVSAIDSGVRNPEPKTPSPETRDFAVFVEGTERPGLQASNLQPDGVGTDIDRGKRGHGKAHSLHGRAKIVTGGWISSGQEGSKNRTMQRTQQRSMITGLFVPGLRGWSKGTDRFRRMLDRGEADNAATAWRNLPAVTWWSAATSDDWLTSPIRLTAVWVSVSQSCQLPTASCSRFMSAMNWPASADFGANSAA